MLSCAVWHHAAAQDSLYYVGGRDTIAYRYTPLTTETPSVEQPQKSKARIFAEKVVNYFGNATADRTLEKKFDFTVVAAPAYTNSTSLLFGVLAAGQYRTDRSDLETQPSNVVLLAKVSITGYYYIGVDGKTFFKRGRHRLDYIAGFQSRPTDFWGLGYDAAMHNKAGKYTSKKYEVSASYRFSPVKRLYIGATVDFNSVYAKNLNRMQYIGNQRTRYTAAGLGPLAEYDSRDAVAAPEKGAYLSVAALFRPKALGNCGSTIWQVRATADFFQRMWRGSVLAVDVYGEFNSLNTPWTMYAAMGGNFRMRGYYEGQFNDRSIMTAQVELRQHIWRRLGCVVWGGAGNVFGSFDDFDWGHTLPNCGIGLRWEFKKRINARLDYGFGGKVNGRLAHGLILALNEAF